MDLIKIAENAGIEKHITPHKFRHAQATDMVRRGYQETIIRKKLGWTGSSNMIERYQHIVDDDVINATLEKTGTDIPRRPITNLKQAESLKIVDASMQLSKLSEENQELKERLAEQDQKQKEQDDKMELVFAALQIEPGLLDKLKAKKA